MIEVSPELPNYFQENLDCRPKNYKKVGTVVGVTGNKVEAEEDNNVVSDIANDKGHNNNLDWRETRKWKKKKD